MERAAEARMTPRTSRPAGEYSPIPANAPSQAEREGLREERRMVEERTSFTVGEEASLTKTITDEDIKTFARISGDDNPVHVNDDYAKGTMFGGRIAHGMLVASLISAVLGTKLPGPGAIYMSQQVRFLAPVRPGDKVTARAQVTEWDGTKGRVTLLTEVTNQGGKPVISGEARLVMSSFLAKK
jgi:3-hydroxybutyryl-CoA dehydratase